MAQRTPPSEQITRWLADWRHGDARARDQLFDVVHPQLRQIAAHFLHRERANHTLEPNALVNELYLRLLAHSQSRIAIALTFSPSRRGR